VQVRAPTGHALQVFPDEKNPAAEQVAAHEADEL